MGPVRAHFAQHRTHLLGCVAAGLLVVAAIVFGLPILAIFGALFCAVMMIGLVWMMFAGVSKHQDRTLRAPGTRSVEVRRAGRPTSGP